MMEKEPSKRFGSTDELLRAIEAVRSENESAAAAAKSYGSKEEGLKALAAALKDHVDITVVAPDSNRSGASNSLTLEVPLRVS